MLTRLSAVLFATSAALAGCSVSDVDDGSTDQECYLPGDKDCAGDGNGKADEWNDENDPARISQNLNYRIDELPLSGQTQREVWAASYWPTYAGSTNHRWQGDDVLSPLEKYDAAFNSWTPDETYATSVPSDCGPDAATEYADYVASRGPAAAWMSTYQGRDRLFNGYNDDPSEDSDVDECYEVIETWWGLCHAWAPAAILEPEPQHAAEYNGQRFEVSDIKALLMTVYDDSVSVGLGGRCNAREVEHDDTGRVTAEECRDTNAGAWHVVVTNLLGLEDQPFVEDRTGGYQVWNQPVLGYEVSLLEEIDVARANELLGITGDQYIYNDRAEKLYEVKMRTDWLTEGHQSTAPLGSASYTRNDFYHYILEVDADGKIIGGEWVGSSRDNHPDFLWLPRRADTGYWSDANPHVNLDQVRTLLELSRN